jgi:hypothetical protein
MSDLDVRSLDEKGGSANKGKPDDKKTFMNLNHLKRFWRVLRQPDTLVLFRKGKVVNEHSFDEFFTLSDFDYFYDVHEYAVLSHAVYGEISEGYAQVDQDKVRLPGNWQPYKNLPALPRESGRLDIDGLHFNVWEDRARKKILIVFRGTRVTSFGDWYANLGLLTRFIPWIRDHYSKVRAYMPVLVEHIRKEYGNDEELTFIAAGHSLGGGLAQQAAYSSPYINTVYAFASSPVTGYRTVESSLREKNQANTKIARIFEHGEILAYLRFLMRRFIKLAEENPEIVEVRFNFSQRKLAVSQHSMGKFAESILKKSPRVDHQHYYKD